MARDERGHRGEIPQACGLASHLGAPEEKTLPLARPAFFPPHVRGRPHTAVHYGGGPELRLKQELLLGIGGWRLLAALGIQPEVRHLNEGQAAFAVLERARSFMQESGQPFKVALAVGRAGNLFTTHTAVELDPRGRTGIGT